MDLRQLLKNHPTFEVASDAKREILAQNMRIVAFPQGSVILEQGASSEKIYVLIEGVVRVTTRDDAAGLLQAKDLTQGDLFGLLGLVPNMPCPAGASAVTDVHAATLSRYAYEQLFASAPALARQLQYMVAIELARALQDRNRALRALLRQGVAAT